MKNYPNNLLSIDQFAQTLGLHPWVVAQVGSNLPPGTGKMCQCAMYETASARQDADGFSRADMAHAIHAAENIFAQQTGYYPAPKVLTDTKQPFPLPLGRYEPIPSLRLKYGYVQSIGTPTLTLLNTVNLTRETTTDDDLKDSFTATVTVPSGTSADQIRAYFTVTDRDGLDKRDWEIRPIRVSISGTTATIQGDAYLLAKPRHIRLMPPISLAADDDDTYVEQIEVWRQTIDSCAQGELTWTEGNCSSTPCSPITKQACFNLIPDPERGEISVGSLMNDCAVSKQLDRATLPDTYTVHYTAGYPLQENGLMDEWHAQIISWLAAALMPCESCACGCIKDMLKEYRNPPTYDKDEPKLSLPPAFLAKMGGKPRWGAILAYVEIFEIKKSR